MTRKSFDEELKAMHSDLNCMSDAVIKQINSSIDALAAKDENLADEVIDGDKFIDRMQRDIEDRCIKLIAKEQPLAKDLRNIFTATKICTDLERMADHAVDIAKIVKHLSGEEYIKKIIDIPKMSRLVTDMISKSIEAYSSFSVDMAYETCKMDDAIDDIYRNIFTELLDMMSNDHSIAAQGSQFLFICKFLERVADHATNICEWTIYLVTGETVDLNE